MNTYEEAELIDLDDVDDQADEDSEDDSITLDEEFLEPEEGDIETDDHVHWYQYGKLVLTTDEDLTTAEMNAEIRAFMEREQYWPNVWWISDHGNAHPMSLQDA